MDVNKQGPGPMASLYIQCFIGGYTLYCYIIIILYISIMVINITFSNLRANCHGNLSSISISPLINRAILSKAISLFCVSASLRKRKMLYLSRVAWGKCLV